MSTVVISCFLVFSEQEILHQEIMTIQAVKTRLQLRVQELEEELRRVKEEAERNAKANKSDDEVSKLYLSSFMDLNGI